MTGTRCSYRLEGFRPRILLPRGPGPRFLVNHPVTPAGASIGSAEGKASRFRRELPEVRRHERNTLARPTGKSLSTVTRIEGNEVPCCLFFLFSTSFVDYLFSVHDLEWYDIYTTNYCFN